MNARSVGVDMRGFQSPLRALERKLEHELDRARMELAALQRDAVSLEESRRALRKERDEQLHCANDLLGAALDPAAYRRCLQYLLSMDRQMEERSMEMRKLETRLAAGRQACVEANRRLASVQAVRDAREASYAQEQARRTGREADLAWLVSACRARAGTGRPTGVAR